MLFPAPERDIFLIIQDELTFDQNSIDRSLGRSRRCDSKRGFWNCIRPRSGNNFGRRV